MTDLELFNLAASETEWGTQSVMAAGDVILRGKRVTNAAADREISGGAGTMAVRTIRARMDAIMARGYVGTLDVLREWHATLTMAPSKRVHACLLWEDFQRRYPNEVGTIKRREFGRHIRALGFTRLRDDEGVHAYVTPDHRPSLEGEI